MIYNVSRMFMLADDPRIVFHFLSSRDQVVQTDEELDQLTITSDISYAENTCVLLRNDNLGWGGGS